MVKDNGVPTHPFAEGVMVMVAITGAELVFVAVKDGILPDPFADNPIDGVLLTQVKVVPVTGLPIETTEVTAPLQ